MSQIQSGVDPTAGPAESGITLKQALDAHLSEKAYSPRTVDGYRYHLDHYLMKFRHRAVTDISRQEVRDLFGSLKRKHGETTAASVIDRKRVVSGKSVSVRVDLGCRRLIHKKKPGSHKRIKKHQECTIEI